MKDYMNLMHQDQYRWLSCPNLETLSITVSEIFVLDVTGTTIIYDVIYDTEDDYEDLGLIVHTVDHTGLHYPVSESGLMVPTLLNQHEFKDEDYPDLKFGFSLQFRNGNFDWVVTARLLEGEDSYDIIRVLEKLPLKKVIEMAYQGYNHRKAD